MPKVGLRKLRYNKITTGTDSNGADTENYGEKKTFGKATTLSTSVNTAQATFYADDGLDEDSSEFVNGQMNVGTGDVEHQALADVTGATLDAESGDLIMKDTDVAPFIRFGGIAVRQKNNVRQYMGLILYKVKFDTPGDDLETKGETIAFRGTTMTARFYRNVNHDYRRYSAWFDTEAEADEWLDEKMAPTSSIT